MARGGLPLRLTVAAVAAAAVALAVSKPPAAANCAIGSLAAAVPCGLPADSQARCEARGCCYAAAASSYLGATPCFMPAAPTSNGMLVNITTVHVVQASHFDAGFADSTVGILNLWFHKHFPRALSIGLALDALDGPERLMFMTQSWIISMFYDCPTVPGLICPTAAEMDNVTQAISKGYLTWHAFPHNAELELADREHIGWAVNLTHELDDRFGQRRKTVLSQRDVPGITRAAVPVLAGVGVRAVSVGVNGGSAFPDVPRIFMWRDTATSTSLPAMWHGLGYGGIGFDDAVLLPGLSHALVFDWRGDNAGPYDSVAEAQASWAALAKTFPGASIVASTFDDWLDVITSAPGALSALPVVTAEIADTWIHGSVSDPQKHAWLRLGQALRTECVASGVCDASDPALKNFSRFFCKNLEHTWGRDIKTYLKDETNWRNDQLQAQLAARAPNFMTTVDSWQEQRDWGFTYALEALGDAHPLHASLLSAFAAVYPPEAQPAPGAPGDGWQSLPPGQRVTAGRFTVAVDGATGALAHLADATSGLTWLAGGSGALFGLPHYQTYTEADYLAFIANYSSLSPNPPSWFEADFGKPNVSSANPLHQELDVTLVSGPWVRFAPGGDQLELLVGTAFAEPAAHAYYGAPAAMWMHYALPTDAAANAFRLTLSSYNKTATRLPEGLFIRFNVTQPAGGPGVQWQAGKLGGWVDPADTVVGGNQHHHGVLQGVRALQPAAAASLTISSPQAGLAVFGHPFALPTPWDGAPAASDGAAFLLEDNTWGTNYPMWSPALSSPWGDDANQRWSFDVAVQ